MPNPITPSSSTIIDELKTAKIIGSLRLLRRCIALYELLNRQLPKSRALRICENILKEDLKPFIEDFNDLSDFNDEDFTVHQMLLDTGYLEGVTPEPAQCGCRAWISDPPLTGNAHHVDCPHSQGAGGFTT